MKIIIYSLLINNFLLIYFFSFANTANKFFNFELNTFSKIIFGYSLSILVISFLYFFFNLENIIVYYILISLSILVFFNIKAYLKYFFFKKINIIVNLIFIVYLIPALIYGEQFYIFRGNYWDSSNYLSSALLFNNYNYNEISNLNFIKNFFEFQSIDTIIINRPLVNYILSIILNLHFSIFYSYFLFKVLITTLIFISLYSFIKDLFKLSSNKACFVSGAFIFSFFNLYIFEIDALSHYASIPILLIVINLTIKIFDNLSIKSNYIIFAITLSSLFIIYTEIIIIPFLFFVALLLCRIKYINTKTIILFLTTGSIFLFLTLPFFTMTYKYLFTSQLGAALRINDWWGYYGSFVIGKDNLVLNESFVINLKNILSQNVNFDKFTFLHQEHFKNNYYFVYLNVFPSIAGLYFFLPGKIDSLPQFFLQLTFTLGIFIYLAKILINNFSYILSQKTLKKKFLLFNFILSIFVFFLVSQNNYWTIIKIYTYILPFLFIFFSFNIKYKKLNTFYLCLVGCFFIYKYSTFNHGIGRHDSFPSIINSKLKKDIIWQDTSYQNKAKCNNISFNENNYIIRTYLNLKFLNLNNESNYNKYSVKKCKIYLKDKKFVISHE